MFADACGRVTEFTRPLVISTRRQDGSVTTECGTFMVINRDGWIVTAAHMYDSFLKYQEDVKKAKEINEINAERADRPGAPSSKIKLDPSYIINHSFWWGWDGVRVSQGYYNRQIDMFVGKLEPFDPSWVKEYPVFRDPSTLRPGTSVCRMGYPFIDIKSNWDDTKKMFAIPKIPYRELIFPNDGIHTRTLDRGKSKPDEIRIRYIETSTPGVKGQSGGPIFDTEGRIYAMQVKTVHMILGFQPTVECDGKTVVENQFMNVGLGVHVGTMLDVLDSKGIRYQCETDRDEYRIVG